MSPFFHIPPIDYNTVVKDLEENGFSFMADPETIPKSVGYRNLEADALHQTPHKLTIMIEFGKNIVLLMISNSEDVDIRERMQQCAKEFEKVYPEKMILEADELLPYAQTILILAKHLAPRIILDFFIPRREKLPPDQDPAFNDKLEELVYNAVNNFDDVSEIIENLQEKTGDEAKNLKGILLILWIRGLISFRLRIENWDILEQTSEAPRYLQDGSEEQKHLIKEMGGEGKILTFLGQISKPITMEELLKAPNLTDFTARKFLQVLLSKNLVRLVSHCPKLTHIPESELPMLIIKGLKEEDIQLLEWLELATDGTKTIQEISLELEEKPERIERILRFLNDFVTWIDRKQETR